MREFVEGETNSIRRFPVNWKALVTCLVDISFCYDVTVHRSAMGFLQQLWIEGEDVPLGGVVEDAFVVLSEQVYELEECAARVNEKLACFSKKSKEMLTPQSTETIIEEDLWNILEIISLSNYSSPGYELEAPWAGRTVDLLLVYARNMLGQETFSTIIRLWEKQHAQLMADKKSAARRQRKSRIYATRLCCAHAPCRPDKKLPLARSQC